MLYFLLEFHKNGIYTYAILNEQEKQISICKIASQDKKITIPSELDGYQVYALGYESHFYNNYSVIKEIGGGAYACSHKSPKEQNKLQVCKNKDQ